MTRTYRMVTRGMAIITAHTRFCCRVKEKRKEQSLVNEVFLGLQNTPRTMLSTGYCARPWGLEELCSPTMRS